MSMAQVNLMHILLLGPLFVYIGEKGSETPEWAYSALGAFACMIPFIVRVPKDLSEYRSVVNASHYIFQFTALLYIAYYKNKNASWVYPVLKWLGVVVILTHVYLLSSKRSS